MPWRFLYISDTPLVTPAALYGAARAGEINARHCAGAWGTEPPTVDVWDRSSTLGDRFPVVFVDEGGDDHGYLAVHRSDRTATVYCQRGTGLLGGRHSWCESAGHEVIEGDHNPFLTRWWDHPRIPGVQVAHELCDMVQDHYWVTVDGERYPAANYVTPSWFDGVTRDYGVREEDGQPHGQYDRLGTIKGPGQLGPEGYQILRRPGGATYADWGASGPTEAKLAKMRRKYSRTRRLGCEV